MTINISGWSERFIDYVLHENYSKIECWFEQGALTSATLVADLQKKQQIPGAFAEIGVHHGGFFIALTLLRSAGEKALAIDVFEDQHQNIDQSGLGDREILIKNLNRFVGSCDDIGILKMDSLMLEPDKTIAVLGGKVRIFSVDGCHTKEHTLNDMVLASKVVVPGGVIILDDITNADWPGVQQGAEAFLNSVEGHDFRPFVCTDNKLILTHDEFYDYYFQGLGQLQRHVYGRSSTRDMHGTPVIDQPFGKLDWYLDNESFEKVYGKKRLSAIRFTVAGSPHFRLLDGWSSPEDWGTWSDGSEARLEVMLDEAPHDDIVLVMNAHGFVTPIRPKIEIEMLVNGTFTGKWAFDSSEDIVEKAFQVPNARLAGARLEITFRIFQPHSPKASSISDDSRLLGIGLRHMSVLYA